MKLSLTAWIPLFLSLAQPTTMAAQFRKKVSSSANFRIEQLAPRVWVAINNDQYGRAICNAGIVDLGNKTLVFDAFLAPSAAAELKEIAKQLTRKPVTLVVNSHHHQDHIRGSQVFLPQATIISTSITKSEIDRVEPEEQEWGKKFGPAMLEAVRKRSINSGATEREELPFWIGYYEGVIEASDEEYIASPDMVFNDSLWIEGSKLSVELVERRNGHTASDAVMLIPSLGIVFMADLLVNGRHPWLSDGDTHAWQASLKCFYEDSIYHTYVPGYGEVAGKDALKILYDYLGELQTRCDAAQTDSARNALMMQPMPAAYRSWLCGRFYQPNIQYLISSAKARADSSQKAPDR